MAHDTLSSVSVDALKKEAQQIFQHQIIHNLYHNTEYFDNRFNHNVYNMWRCAWAYDTFNDYFEIFPSEATTTVVPGDTNPLYKQIMDTYFAATGGNWWDDFAWAGIAALRAANSSISYSADVEASYVQLAVNAYAYMHGPGWSTSTAMEDVVPFPKLAGWKELLHYVQNHGSDIGAPNSYNHVPATVNGSPGTDFAPGVTPGGIWNAPINANSKLKPIPTADPTVQNLASIQNTVTNGSHTVLSLRLLHAYHSNSTYKTLMDNAKVDVDKMYSFWSGQMSWFNGWMGKTGDHSMKMDAGSGVLVRERAPSYASGDFDSSFYPKLAWTGDQGILTGALLDYAQAKANPQAWLGKTTAPVYNNLPDAADIIMGVHDSCYGQDSQATSALHPWVFHTEHSNDLNDSFGPGDDGDYRTGNAVFYRYLGQYLDAGNTISLDYQHRIIDEAEAILNNKIPNDNPAAYCEGYSYNYWADGNTDTGKMTHYVNRLATICLAIKVLQNQEGN